MGKKKEPEIRFIVLDVSDSNELLQIANEELAYALNELHDCRALNDYRAMILKDLNVSRANLFHKNNGLMEEIQDLNSRNANLRVVCRKAEQDKNFFQKELVKSGENSVWLLSELTQLKIEADDLRNQVAKHKEEITKLVNYIDGREPDQPPTIATEEELQELRNKLMGD